MTFEVRATIKMSETAHGGRLGPARADWFQCPVDFGSSRLNETRFFLQNTGPLIPGSTHRNVLMDFLCRVVVQKYLIVGKEFDLREGDKRIGAGQITSVNIDLEPFLKNWTVLSPETHARLLLLADQFLRGEISWPQAASEMLQLLEPCKNLEEEDVRSVAELVILMDDLDVHKSDQRLLSPDVRLAREWAEEYGPLAMTEIAVRIKKNR